MSGRVHVNGHALVAMHPANLRFPKVGRDPDVVERNDRKKLLARLHSLPDLYGLVAHHSGGGCDDMRVAQIEPGLIERGLCRIHRGLCLADQSCRRGDRCTVRVDCGRGDLSLLDDFVVGLLGNDALVKEFPVAHHVPLSLDVGRNRGVKIREGKS